MRRRDFIKLVGASAAAAWPAFVRAQQKPVPVIGFLSSRSAGESTYLVAAFRRGLNEAGVEDKDADIEFRWADGRYDMLPKLAAELAERNVSVLVATGGIVSARAAKAVTTTIPIVFVSTGDPIGNGLVASLNRPGGNVTGASLITAALGGKRLALLLEVIPAAPVIAMLVNPKNPDAEQEIKDIQQAGAALKRETYILYAQNQTEFEAAFATVVQRRIGALVVGADPFFTSQRDELVALAARSAIPAIYSASEYVLAGGLMSYGTNLGAGYRQAGVYAGQILKGASPANLPVVQPTTYELAINLKAARALGLSIPQTLLVTADEVVE
jgi:putative ABC transport system substrate-binding protein